jgi:hypothetical protein
MKQLCEEVYINLVEEVYIKYDISTFQQNIEGHRNISKINREKIN